MNKINRGNAEMAGQAMIVVGVIFIALAACAVFVWPNLVADDTALYNTIAGAGVTLAGVFLLAMTRNKN